MMRSTRGLLAVLSVHRIDADDADSGLAQLHGLLPSHTVAELAEAVGAAVRNGWLRDPVRLLPGRLHCRWQLELTQAGRALAASDPARHRGSP